MEGLIIIFIYVTGDKEINNLLINIEYSGIVVESWLYFHNNPNITSFIPSDTNAIDYQYNIDDPIYYHLYQ